MTRELTRFTGNPRASSASYRGIQYTPVAAHRHHLDIQRLQPVGQGLEIVVEGAETPNRLVVAVRIDHDSVLPATNVNPRAAGMNDLPWLFFGLARHGRCSHAGKRGARGNAAAKDSISRGPGLRQAVNDTTPIPCGPLSFSGYKHTSA